MNKSQAKKAIPLFGGFAIGMALSLAFGIALYAKRSNTLISVTPLSTVKGIALASTHTPVPTHTTLARAIQDTSVRKLLESAQISLDSGKSKRVRNLLFPVIENWSSIEDKVTGYTLLGQAELTQGHSKLAAPFFEKVYFYQPTPENLFKLATIHDMGGNLCKALEYYQQLNTWNDPEAQIDREFIKIRIEDISCALGTPVPIQP